MTASHDVVVIDEEFRMYAAVVLVSTVLLWRLLQSAGTDPWSTLRHAAFQTASILATTGYASLDFQLGNDQVRMVLFLLMFIGGGAGSAAGGPNWCATC